MTKKVEVPPVLIHRFIDAIRGTEVEPELQKHDDALFRVFKLPDIALTYIEIPRGFKFFGITFELVGTDFFITEDSALSLLSQEDEQSFIIEDPRLMQMIEDFLNWRIKMLEQFSI